MSRGKARKPTPEFERDRPNEWPQMRVGKSVCIRDHDNGRRSVTEFYGELGRFYNLRHAYDRAHELKDPYLAPHGFFRRLAHGNTGHAREFLEKFGPLVLSAGKRFTPGCHVGVSLEQFWTAHSRFCLVTNLWESRDDRARLAAALLEVYRHRQDRSPFEELPIGTKFGPPPSTNHQLYRFPWEEVDQEPEEWLHRAGLADLRNCAFYLIHLELNLHMRSRHIVWQRSWEPPKEGWRVVIWTESLWSAMWEFWGCDTASLSWRRCPHCQRLFYPKRRDQFYCKPRQQALASKREYARKLRARQKHGKKLQKRQGPRNRKEPQQ